MCRLRSDDSGELMKTRKKPMNEDADGMSEVVLGSDGSIGVKCKDVIQAKKIALELHRRQERRLLTDFQYR